MKTLYDRVILNIQFQVEIYSEDLSAKRIFLSAGRTGADQITELLVLII